MVLRVIPILLACVSAVPHHNTYSFGGNELAIYWIEEMQALVFNVYVKANSWFAIGYGHSMYNTDVVFWAANGTES